jgi:hypothetical protein
LYKCVYSRSQIIGTLGHRLKNEHILEVRTIIDHSRANSLTKRLQTPDPALRSPGNETNLQCVHPSDRSNRQSQIARNAGMQNVSSIYSEQFTWTAQKSEKLNSIRRPSRSDGRLRFGFDIPPPLQSPRVSKLVR